jgi:DNA-directed RNA polymerase subunit L
MIKLKKITITKILQETELGNSRFEFKISGENINYIIVNTIRRTILSDIPIYAFNEFKFEKNTSIFHYNYLKLRLQQLPVWKIENNIDSLNKENNKENKIDDKINEVLNEDDEDIENEANDMDLQEEYNEENVEELDSDKKKENINNLTMYVNYINKTLDIITITTSHAKFYYNQKQIESPYHIPIPLIKLQSEQQISFSAITKLGTEEEHTLYSAVSVAAYKEINENEFDFFIESRGQRTEKNILSVALLNINMKLQNFLNIFLEEKHNYEDEGIIIINNEDHTLGNLISNGLQQHTLISFAGYNLHHPLSKIVHIHYKLKEGNLKEIMKNVITYYHTLFIDIKKSLDAIKKN